MSAPEEHELNDDDLEEIKDMDSKDGEKRPAGPETKAMQKKVARFGPGFWLVAITGGLVIIAGMFAFWGIPALTQPSADERVATAAGTERRAAPPPPEAEPPMSTSDDPEEGAAEAEDEGESDVGDEDEGEADTDPVVDEAVADQAEAAIAEHEAEEESEAPIVPAETAPTAVAAAETSPCRLEHPSQEQVLACYDRLLAMAAAIRAP